jgi:predicted transcriptional regulator
LNWKTYGYVVASRYRIKVIISLQAHPNTPKQISSETNMAITHASRALKELSMVGLLHCINPENLKGRVYKLTKEGVEIAQLLHNVQ